MDDDSASMTIDFLRARLLSERSVSRTARQRADHLANRVVELEEQLKFISLQRKKAEKATSDVLAILENNGLTDHLSDQDYDSDTDQATTPFGSQLGNNEEDEMSVTTSKSLTTNGDEQLSGSEDFSSIPGKSLSWKSTKHTQRSVEKKYMTSSKRCSSYSSVASSSPKHRSGKSCRQIRRRETRMEESRVENIVHGHHSIAVTPSSEGTRNCSESGTELLGEGSEIMEEKVTNSRHCLNGHGGGNKDMERALEQQAQLIGRYEDEEKAQRDWEERFRENNSSPPDSCEPGNQSDITEERDEIKTRVSDEIAPNNETAKSGKIEFSITEELSKETQTIFQPPAHTCESQVSECMVNEKQAQAQLQNYPPSDNQQRSLPCGSLVNQTPPFISSNTRNENYAIVPHKPVRDLGGVLEALKQAKSSLQHRLDKLPLLEGGSVGRHISTVRNLAITKSETKMEIPVGCANLFRVPSDSQLEATFTKPNPYIENRSSVSNNDQYLAISYLENKSSVLSNDRRSIPNPYLEIKHAGDPYMETRLDVSSNDGFISYKETGGSRISSQRQFVDPYISGTAGIPPSSRYGAYPAGMAFPNMKSQIAATEEGHLRSSLLHLPSGVSSFYDDHSRPPLPPNVYR